MKEARVRMDNSRAISISSASPAKSDLFDEPLPTDAEGVKPGKTEPARVTPGPRPTPRGDKDKLDR